MPLNTAGLEVGRVLVKTYRGVTYNVLVTEQGFEMNGEFFSSLSNVERRITARPLTSGCSGWQFFGLVNPNRARRQSQSPNITVTEVLANQIQVAAPVMTCSRPNTGKCAQKGCYEPADCKHGFCHRHCNQTHRLGSNYERSSPQTMEPHAAVEIEVKFPNQDAYRRGLPLNGVHDGSLGTYGAEFKVMATSEKVIDAVSEMMKELWTRGAKVTRDCGMHVHLDVRQASYEQTEKMQAWLMRTQEVWFRLVPPSRRNNIYVNRIHTIGQSDHYCWAHRTPYNTMEIRIHGGTLNHFKVRGWLVALLHLQAKNNAGFDWDSVNSGSADQDFWAVFADCADEGREYLEARINNNGVVQDMAFRCVEE